jgi:hypothetical protein
VLSDCPGCGLRLPSYDGPTHPYLTASPACWREFGLRLAADYTDPERMAFHQLVVDAYAGQHPGEGDRRQVQSVGLHLMTLCLFLEHDTDPALGAELHRRMIRRPSFRRLVPGNPTLPVLHVPVTGSAAVARTATYEWGRAVWEQYVHEHDTVRGWLAEAGLDPR